MRMPDDRRKFLQSTAVAGTGFWVAGGLAAKESLSANAKIQVASIGVGGKGHSDTTNASRFGRIVAVCDVDRTGPEDLEKAMEANFHSALDARYAISNGTVWAAFIHPLSEITERMLRSAIRQVATARVTFGNEFTSGELYFGG